jgi:hypothetical protein
MAHARPFHVSASGARKVPAVRQPTAAQAAWEMQETARSWLSCAAAGLGDGCIFQRFPFHASTRVSCLRGFSAYWV